MTLPLPIERLVDTLAGMPGVVGVALGGSRSTGAADPRSDWDLAVYYAGTLDTSALATYGPVHPPGSWGRLMNGGAWLELDGCTVDVLFRDVDVVQHWTRAAERGAFELDALLGYLAGIPTYTLAAELALGQALRGAVPSGAEMPDALREAAPLRWRFSRDFSLEYAHMHAQRGNVVAAAGQVAKAIVEEAHARVCARGIWTVNEKWLLARAGLDAIQPAFAEMPSSSASLARWINDVAAHLRAGVDESGI